MRKAAIISTLKMEKIIINIGASSDHFGAYAENCDGIYGAGNTVQEAKENVIEGLKLLVKTTKQEELPEILKSDYEIVYRFDTKSLLQYYANIFNKPALERITGINQKQLHHYSSGLKRPRIEQRKKIEMALHSLGKELMAVSL